MVNKIKGYHRIKACSDAVLFLFWNGTTLHSKSNWPTAWGFSSVPLQSCPPFSQPETLKNTAASDSEMTSIPQIVLSSRNEKKIGEIAELFAPYGIRLIGVREFAHVPEVEEDGDSFAANAAKKATLVAKTLNCWVIAEDSGLCVDALGGAPGIYSARYAGEQGADALNNEKLLQELSATPTEKRTA
jgi:hypothetical protein